jgi:prevent-host-death family protein
VSPATNSSGRRLRCLRETGRRRARPSLGGWRSNAHVHSDTTPSSGGWHIRKGSPHPAPIAADPCSATKAHLSELFARVYGQHERVTVTVHGRPSAVLLSVEDLESLEATIAILCDTDAVLP